MFSPQLLQMGSRSALLQVCIIDQVNVKLFIDSFANNHFRHRIVLGDIERRP